MIWRGGAALTEENEGKLELISCKSFQANDELVRVVDFLNKNLKSKKVMFGISKDKENDLMTINIYEFQ
ncbi:MAG: YpmA family protein [Syntrophomonas sp.]|nr:YpmA family protein [Syntrophomonas sp.]